MVTSIKADSRNDLTKSEVKQLRQEGKVPGVVYGKTVGNRTISVEAKVLLSLLRANPHAILELDLMDSGKHPVMVHEVQKDKIKGNLLHIDFHQVNMDEPVRTSVLLEFVGEPKAEEEGGMLQILLHEVEIRCLPADIPESIKVDVSVLELGDTKVVGDLVLPTNVELKTPSDEVILTVLAPQKQEETATVTAADAPKDVAASAEKTKAPVH